MSVCPSICLLGQKWRLNLGNFSLIYIVNRKFSRYYSSKTVRCSMFELRQFFISCLKQSCTCFHKCPALGCCVISLTSFCVTDNPSWRGIRVSTEPISSSPLNDTNVSCYIYDAEQRAEDIQVTHLWNLQVKLSFQEKTSTGTHVFLLDKSSNGTFINGEKVGEVIFERKIIIKNVWCSLLSSIDFISTTTLWNM